MTEIKNKTIGNAMKATNELKKAFRYYNYVREFYGDLMDSIGLSLEPGNKCFDPATAPAEKKFPPAVDEKNSLPELVTLDKMNRAIRAYEQMIKIVAALSTEDYETGVKECAALRDTEKPGLTFIAEVLLVPSLWREFDEHSQDMLHELADETRGFVILEDPRMIEESIGKIFMRQKTCLEEFLPRKLEELKKLHAEIGQ